MSRVMTREGFEAIRAEIDELWTKERPYTVAQVAAAAETGDRSENAAYIYGKRRLREIDSRLHHLRNRIKDVTVLDLGDMPQHPDIRFGCIVELSLDDSRHMYRLVDQEESDPKKGRVSVQSPLGKALLGRKPGDAFEVTFPKGPVSVEVHSIRYAPGPP